MQQHNRAHRMQGTRKATLMSFFQGNQAATPAQLDPPVSLRNLLCGVFLAVFLTVSARLGATPVWVNLSEFTHGITYPSGTFKAGDTVEITIWAGTAADPVNDALGWDVELYLTTHAQFLSTPPPMNLNTSWIATGTAYETNATAVSEERMYQYHCLRTDDSPKSGYGTLFKVKLVALVDDITAQSMVESMGGGLAIENVDNKTGVLTNRNTVSEPCTVINLNTKGLRLVVDAPVQHVQMVTLQGNGYPISDELLSGTYDYEFNEFPAGIYTLIYMLNNVRYSRKIILE